MEVILKQDIEKLGKKFEIVKIADGHGRNYLIPRGLAVPVTEENMKMLEAEKEKARRIENKLALEAKEICGKIESLTVTIKARVGEEGKLFGSVTSSDLADALAAEKIEVDKRKIELEEPIKTLGNFTVPIKLHKDAVANLKLWVIKEN